MANHREANNSSQHQTQKSIKPTERSLEDYQCGTENTRIDSPLTFLKYPRDPLKLQGNERATGAEDLVKHVSHLPSYLQHTGKKHNFQENVLNLGVLNWGRLEKWDYQQRRTKVERTVGHSPSSTDCSTSSFSTFESSSISGRSDWDTWSLTQTKKFSSLDHPFSSSNNEIPSHTLGRVQSTDKVSSSLIFKNGKKKEYKPNLTKSLLQDHKLESLHSNSKVHTPCEGNTSVEVKKKGNSSPIVSHSCPFAFSSESGEFSAEAVGCPVDKNVRKGRAIVGQSLPISEQNPTLISKGRHFSRRHSSASMDITQRDKKNDCSRSKLSPLRRILDPLMKHRSSSNLGESICNHSPASHETPASTHQEPDLSKANSSCFMSQSGRRKQKPLSWASFYMIGSLQGDKRTKSSMHALLQLGFKNGLPLVTFTYNDTEIIAAIMKKAYIPEKDDFACIYTFYSVHIINGGGGANQGNKSREQDYQSNIIARMEATCYPRLGSGESEFVTRKFVLSSAVGRLVEDDALDFPPDSELAAIVVKVPNEYNEDFGKSNMELNQYSCIQDNSNGLKSLQSALRGENQKLPSIVAILPSGVHGRTGINAIPSSLIDRWRTGGSCDCGGWDVGCMLTILANKEHPGQIFSSCQGQATSKSIEVNLFIQGGPQENRHVFSLVAIKKGLYMVDFSASISLLQAFSISIAILHDQKHARQSKA